jgi:hypothetical protein
VPGILADVNVIGHVQHLVQLMQAEPWAEFWQELSLVLRHFQDVGLTPTSSDLEIWHRCQAENLVLITDNRNDDAADSLEAAIRQYNRPESLPVFTIANLERFRTSREYADQVAAKLFEYLLDLDAVRGTGRLYLP